MGKIKYNFSHGLVIMQKSDKIPQVEDPFKLVLGMLKHLRGKKTSVELQHEATKIWAKKYTDKKKYYDK